MVFLTLNVRSNVFEQVVGGGDGRRRQSVGLDCEQVKEMLSREKERRLALHVSVRVCRFLFWEGKAAAL